jgi:hypothetical protein
MYTQGYIPISRKLFEHRYWCEGRVYSRFEAWLDLVQSARFEDAELFIGGRLIKVRKGQLPASLRYLAERWRWSTKKVNAFLVELAEQKMATKESPKGTGQTLLTLCSYERYNFSAGQQNQLGNTKRNTKGNSKETPSTHESSELYQQGGQQGNTKGNTKGNSEETARKQQGNESNKVNNYNNNIIHPPPPSEAVWKKRSLEYCTNQQAG